MVYVKCYCWCHSDNEGIPTVMLTFNLMLVYCRQKDPQKQLRPRRIKQMLLEHQQRKPECVYRSLYLFRSDESTFGNITDGYFTFHGIAFNCTGVNNIVSPCLKFKF